MDSSLSLGWLIALSRCIVKQSRDIQDSRERYRLR